MRTPEKFESSIDWEWAARAPGTLVILMGLERVESICRRLLDEGRSADTSVAVVSAGTLPQQRSVFASLSELPDVVLQAGLRSPAIIVVGEVARFPHMVASSELLSLAAAV
jgi:siroheme synthase